MKCMCSCYQKLYSSLNLLNQIKMDNDFLDNVSYLDSFFNEFRNITFTLQKSIDKNPKELKIYTSLIEKYLKTDDSEWLKETRNKVLKEGPFYLTKKVSVSVYYIDKEKVTMEYSFNMESEDTTKEIITKKIIEEFSKIETSEPDIFFSIKYIFMDKEEEIDIFKIINNGINSINKLLDDFSTQINNDCERCEELKKKISDKLMSLNILQLNFITDGSYNVLDKKIEFSDKSDIYTDKGVAFFSKDIRLPVKDDKFLLIGNNLKEKFISFSLFHYILYEEQEKHLLPTFIIIYEDETYSIESLIIFNKAAMYRKINEIANRIISDKITAIFAVYETIGYDINNKEIYSLSYSEREKLASKEFLSFSMITNELKEININIDSKKTHNLKILKEKIELEDNNFINVMFEPIRKKFTSNP